MGASFALPRRLFGPRRLGREAGTWKPRGVHRSVPPDLRAADDVQVVRGLPE
jgi:hypothetical protein